MTSPQIAGAEPGDVPKTSILFGFLAVPTASLFFSYMAFGMVPSARCVDGGDGTYVAPSLGARHAFIALIAALSLINVVAAGIAFARVQREEGRVFAGRLRIALVALAVVVFETGALAASREVRQLLGVLFIPGLIFAVLPWLATLVDVMRGRGLLENRNLVVVCLLTTGLLLLPDIAYWHLHHLTTGFCFG